VWALKIERERVMLVYVYKKEEFEVYTTKKKKTIKMPGLELKEVMKLLGEDGVPLNKTEFARRWALHGLVLPACVRKTVEGGCKGLMRSDGLYTQCMQKVCKDGFCKRCMNSFVEEGMPRLGLWSERLAASRVGDGEWKTTDGKSPLSWGSYLKKKKMTREDGEEFLAMKNVDVSSIPAHEWELPSRKRRGRVRVVSDTSDEGERTTIRFLPVEGKKKSPKKDESHVGANGKMLRVCVYQESKVVTKVNVGNWTDEAHAKFAEMYCEGRMGEDEGKEFGKSTKRKKKDAAADQLAEMQAQMAAMKAEYEAKLAAVHDTWGGVEEKVAREASKETVEQTQRKCELVKQIKKLEPGYSGGEVGDDVADIIAQMEDKLKQLTEKKRKEAAVKKMRAEKKAKAEAEKKAKAEAEKKRRVEEMKKQLAALEAENEMLGEFDDSDDEEGQEFNPFEHNGVQYHRDDEDKLYTEDGDYWGYINDNGEAVEGDEEE
tara:strand:- start:313 stop:1776 length:1464 start_codon:yes stop_codon:yes gene_type:complete